MGVTQANLGASRMKNEVARRENRNNSHGFALERSATLFATTFRY
jgi:hypothetical protein